MMTNFVLSSRSTALVLIDLQYGIVGMETAPHAAGDVVARSAALAAAFRAVEAPVIYVRVDLRDMKHPTSDIPAYDPTAPLPPEAASDFVPESGVQDSDIQVTKRQWGAFYGTALDQQLRRQEIKTLVLAGLVTNVGIESTARAAVDLGYDVVFAEDAMSSISAESHFFAVQNIFGFMGRVRQSSEIAEALTQ